MRWKEPLWIAMFVMAWFPVGMLIGTTTFNISQTYPQDFSIYNEDWNGFSDFRALIEQDGHDVLGIQSSMSVITRLNGNGVLVVAGPVRDFTVDAVLLVFDHISNGGSILIADDFGTANSSFMLLNTLISGAVGSQAPINIEGLLSFTGGVLFDLDSYDKSPRLPVIRNFNPGLEGGALTAGVNALHLNYATALNPNSALGMAGVAWTTERTWCEIDDPFGEAPYPGPHEWNGSLPVVGAIDLGFIHDEIKGKIVAISDPSLFTNDMIIRGDNYRFARNVISWLTDSNPEIPVVFSEHLLQVPPISTEFFFGLYLSRVLWLSTMPFFAPLYPLVTAIGIKKYLPEMKKPEVKSVSEVFLRKGQTYFSERMTYYRTEGNYARVVKMIYRKLRRDLIKKHMWNEYDAKKLWTLMSTLDSKIKEADFFKKIDRIEEISSNPFMKIGESEMMDLFFFMRDIQSKLIDKKR